MTIKHSDRNLRMSTMVLLLCGFSRRKKNGKFPSTYHFRGKRETRSARWGVMQQEATADSDARVPVSQGVDLSLLERLRVLVRNEFEPEATREELVVALRRNHNNLGDAYHWLKHERRQQQLVVGQPSALLPSDMSRDGGSSYVASEYAGNGIKRRTQTDDADEVVEITPSKRQRSLALRTVDLSQEDGEDVHMTQSTQSQSGTALDGEAEGRPRLGSFSRHKHADRENAVIALHQVVAELQTSRDEEVSSAPWLVNLMETLSVPRGPDLENQVIIVVRALANTLKHVEPGDSNAVKTDGVNQIIDVLLAIPQQNEYDVVMELSPPNEDFGKYDAAANKSYSLALADELNKLQRAEAAQNAIAEITRACASCISRQEAIRGSVKRALRYRRCARRNIHTLEHDLRTNLDQAKRKVESSEREMAEARLELSKQTQALLEVVLLHKEQFLEQGEDMDEAEVSAYTAVLTSKEPDMLDRCKSRAERRRLFESVKQEVIRTNVRLEFFQKLFCLLEAVKPRVEQWAELSSSQIEIQRSTAEREVGEKLKEFVPKLTHVLRLYYDFHTIRQKIASRDRSKQEQLLVEHEDLYGDQVPTHKRDIQNKIQQFNGVIVYSTQQMREVAHAQSNLWLGKQDLLPREMFGIVEKEYSKLWSELSGGARDMMRDCVTTICDYPITLTTSISLAPKLKVESSLQFTSKAPDIQTTLSRPSSPIVDLTLDQDGDQKMEDNSTYGGHGENLSTGSEASDASPGFSIPTTNHEFAVGATLFSRVSSSDGSIDYCCCHVKELREDGSYRVVFDGGDEYPAERVHLLTREEMMQVQQQEAQSLRDDSGKGCILM